MSSHGLPAAEQAPAILCTIAGNFDVGILSAALPLLEAGRVEALEWAFDTLYWAEQVPGWFTDLLHTFGRENRLIGHGVYFSLLSGRWTAEQQQWLDRLRQLSSELHFDHITEHFGFFTGQNFHYGAPLPIPYSAATLQLGQDRLARIQEACRRPVGLENLAFAYSLEEVNRQGEFLDKLLEPVNGFLILDLHNLYCQLHNFAVSYKDLIARYPLHRVREIHISGGSWEESALVPGRQIRRDTHDEAVPEEVFALLACTLPRCPQLKYVVLEQLGTGLQTEESRARFRLDFGRMEKLVQQYRQQLPARAAQSFLPTRPLALAGLPREDARLYEQQAQLSRILENAPGGDEARQQLLASGLAGTHWDVELWAPHMLETAVSIAQKWKK